MIKNKKPLGNFTVISDKFTSMEDEPNRVFHTIEGMYGNYWFTAKTDNSHKRGLGYASDGIKKGCVYKLEVWRGGNPVGRDYSTKGGHVSEDFLARYFIKWEFKPQTKEDRRVVSDIVEWLDNNICDLKRSWASVKFDNGGAIEINSKNTDLEKTLTIQDWYTKNYPTDDLGREINADITFESLWNYMSQGYNFYEVIGVGDSVVRERIFGKLSEILNVDYDDVYDVWLNADKFASGGAVENKTQSSDLNKLCGQVIYESINDIAPIFTNYIISEENKLVYVFKEELSTYQVEEIQSAMNMLKDCHHIVKPQVHINYDENFKSIFFKLKQEMEDVETFKHGGALKNHDDYPLEPNVVEDFVFDKIYLSKRNYVRFGKYAIRTKIGYEIRLIRSNDLNEIKSWQSKFKKQ